MVSNESVSDLFWPTEHLAKYDLGDMIGCGSYGQVIAATRKVDNMPVRTGNKLKIILRVSVNEDQMLSHDASCDGISVNSRVIKA